jgi:hypothetical protein
VRSALHWASARQASLRDVRRHRRRAGSYKSMTSHAATNNVPHPPQNFSGSFDAPHCAHITH